MAVTSKQQSDVLMILDFFRFSYVACDSRSTSSFFKSLVLDFMDIIQSTAICFVFLYSTVLFMINMFTFT